MDAMSEAIEGAAVMLYGVSELYKESPNCRLELNYGAQVLKADQRIPLMMQASYRATGWLGLLMGSSMYHEFYPSAIDSEVKFRSKVDGLTRELGDRGRIKAQRSFVSEGVPPTIAAVAPAPAPAPAYTQAQALVSLAPALAQV